MTHVGEIPREFQKLQFRNWPNTISNILTPVQWNKGSCLDDWSQFEPSEGHKREGEDAEGGAHDQGEQGTEHQAHLDQEHVEDITVETV